MGRAVDVSSCKNTNLSPEGLGDCGLPAPGAHGALLKSNDALSWWIVEKK